MSLIGLLDSQITQYEQELLGQVPDQGAIGNTTLLRHLQNTNSNWTDDLYWAIRNRLVERGTLDRGRGKGGSVRRINSDVAPITRPVPIEPIGGAERDLYEPMLKVIKENWSPDSGFDVVIVEDTSSGGRRADGKWSRPDVTLATYKTYPYVPGRHFDLITFEIKPTDGIDVTVVYEALAHRRAATRAYTLLHIPDDQKKGLEPILREIELEAKRVGVGVIIAGSPNDYNTWEDLVEAERHEPEPSRLNDFLAKQVSPGFREEIIRWFR